MKIEEELSDLIAEKLMKWTVSDPFWIKENLDPAGYFISSYDFIASSNEHLKWNPIKDANHHFEAVAALDDELRANLETIVPCELGWEIHGLRENRLKFWEAWKLYMEKYSG